MEQLANAILFYTYAVPIIAILVGGGIVLAVIMWKRSKKKE